MLLVERIEHEVRAAQQAVLIAQVLGGEAECMSLVDAIGNLDDLLTSEPVVMDDADRELREALGLRSGRG